MLHSQKSQETPKRAEGWGSGGWDGAGQLGPRTRQGLGPAMHRMKTNSPGAEESVGRCQTSAGYSPALSPPQEAEVGLGHRGRNKDRLTHREQDTACLRSSSHNLLSGAAQPGLSFSRRGQAQPELS